MSEGLQHVQERNRQWDAGNARAAWFENRILEPDFAPVLDAPSYVSRTGHRWPPAQRADAEARAAETAADFRSRAQGEFPIFTWSRPVFVTLAAALVATMTSLAVLFARRRTH